MYYITLFIAVVIFKRKKGREVEREKRERKKIMKEKERRKGGSEGKMKEDEHNTGILM